MTSRRGFLASLAGAAAIALDPERALWVPGAKLISIPRPSSSPIAVRYYATYDADQNAIVDVYKVGFPTREGFRFAGVHVYREAFTLIGGLVIPDDVRTSLARNLGVDPSRLVLAPPEPKIGRAISLPRPPRFRSRA